MNTYENWLLEVNDRVATLTLNRPKKKNNLGGTTLPELTAICKEIESIPEVAAVVVRAAGDGFCSGADLNGMFGAWQKSQDEIVAYFQEMGSHFNSLRDLNKPTIAKINGYCIAGGILLALMCDFRVASNKAYFSLSEVKLSLMTFLLTQNVKRVCGVNNTKEIILLSEKFGAAQALKYNLINQVAEAGELDITIAKYTDRLKQLPTLAIAGNKSVINQDISNEESLIKEIEGQLSLMKTQDFQEAIQSFMQKREPNYQGK